MDQRIANFLLDIKTIGLTKTTERQNIVDELIPNDLWRSSRKNIEKVCWQINESYSYEIYDGALVLIRKLMEMLLILSFKHISQESSIKDSDNNYRQLSEIITIAKENRTIDLTRSAKENLELFREKGNLSAHNPFHNALKSDLDKYQTKLRQLVEELFYKAGII